LIVVDSSALMAVVADEPEAQNCLNMLYRGAPPVISAATMAEALIVADRRNVGGRMRTLIGQFGFIVDPVDHHMAELTVAAYALWGKGVHPAALNYADCFAYAAAKHYGAPLLFIGGDFAKTDIVSALSMGRH
jgi:ribonuclease VapC